MIDNSSTPHSVGFNNSTSPDPWMALFIGERDQVISVIFGVFVLLSGLGTFLVNLFVISLVVFNKSLWQARSLLVINIALPNVLFPPLVHGFTAYSAFVFRWVISYEICQVVAFVTTVYRLNTWLSVTLLSLDRLFSVLYPLRYFLYRPYYISVALILEWSAILGLALPPVVMKIVGFDLNQLTCEPTSCSDWGEEFPHHACRFFAIVSQCLGDLLALLPLVIYFRMLRIARSKLSYAERQGLVLGWVKTSSNNNSGGGGGSHGNAIPSSSDSGHSSHTSGSSLASGPDSVGGSERPLVAMHNHSGGVVAQGSSAPSSFADGPSRESGRQDSTDTVHIKKELKLTQNLTGLLFAVISTFAPGAVLRFFIIIFAYRPVSGFSLTYVAGGCVAVMLIPAFIFSEKSFKTAVRRTFNMKK